MFHHRIDRETPTGVIFHWLLLAFLSGNVNSGGLLACGRFVSHMTGFYTLFGQSAAHLTWDAALGFASIPVYFLIGTMISALLVELPIQRGQKGHYILVMNLVCGCLTLAAVLGHHGYFGTFGDTHLSTGYVLLALLCMASGLQNAAVSVASGHSVRTTHMTGNTTDLGIGIVRTLSMRKYTQGWEDEKRATLLRAGVITAFAIGSAFGAMLFIQFTYAGFFLPAGIALYSALREALLSRKGPEDATGRMVFLPRLKRSKHPWYLDRG